MAVPKRKTSKAKTRSRRAANWTLGAPRAQRLPPVRDVEAAPHRVPELRLVQGSRRGRGQLS